MCIHTHTYMCTYIDCCHVIVIMNIVITFFIVVVEVDVELDVEVKVEVVLVVVVAAAASIVAVEAIVAVVVSSSVRAARSDVCETAKASKRRRLPGSSSFAKFRHSIGGLRN